MLKWMLSAIEMWPSDKPAVGVAQLDVRAGKVMWWIAKPAIWWMAQSAMYLAQPAMYMVTHAYIKSPQVPSGFLED